MDRREVVVETRNLSMHFGGVRAVDNVDFELKVNIVHRPHTAKVHG